MHTKQVQLNEGFPVPDSPGSPETSVVELPLLLAGTEADALEEAAARAGLTVGRLLRLLVRDFLTSAAVPGTGDGQKAHEQLVVVRTARGARPRAGG
jgi:hypothetical protein